MFRLTTPRKFFKVIYALDTRYSVMVKEKPLITKRVRLLIINGCADRYSVIADTISEPYHIRFSYLYSTITKCACQGVFENYFIFLANSSIALLLAKLGFLPFSQFHTDTSDTPGRRASSSCVIFAVSLMRIRNAP